VECRRYFKIQEHAERGGDGSDGVRSGGGGAPHVWDRRDDAAHVPGFERHVVPALHGQRRLQEGRAGESRQWEASQELRELVDERQRTAGAAPAAQGPPPLPTGPRPPQGLSCV